MPTARRTADSAGREKSVATSTFANLLRGRFCFIENPDSPHSLSPHHTTTTRSAQARNAGGFDLFAGGSVLLGLGLFAELAEGFLQARLKAYGDGIRLTFTALINLDRLARGIEDHPAVGTLRDVLLKLLADRKLDFAV